MPRGGGGSASSARSGRGSNNSQHHLSAPLYTALIESDTIYKEGYKGTGWGLYSTHTIDADIWINYRVQWGFMLTRAPALRSVRNRSPGHST